MSYIFILVGGYFVLLFLVQSILLYLLILDKKEKIVLPSPLPFVSVLLAVRNEGENILDCLSALDVISWPEDKLEILIGDDASEDATRSLMEAYCKNKPKFRIFSITENLGSAKGKANVLAHLARAAKGAFFCITDADIRVKKTWVEGLVGTMAAKDATISGVSMVKGKTLLAHFQSIDWIYALGMVRVITTQGIPISAVGNNMLISRQAYFATGGYENLPFSITEDFALFQETLKKGWSYKNLLQEEVLAFSEPMQPLRKLLNQRKRWMSGAMQLPFLPIFVLGLQAMAFPFLLAALCFTPYGFLLWAIKFFLQAAFIILVLKKVGQLDFVKYILIYEVLALAVGFLQAINYFLPGKVEWKGRKYGTDSR